MNKQQTTDYYPVIRKKNAVRVMCQNRIGGTEYLTFSGLAGLDCVSHLFSTRIGGVSEGMFASMNLSFTRGDNEAAVRENFHRIAEILCIKEDCFVLSHQTHTDHIRIITREDAGSGLTKPLPYQDVDGLVTNEKRLVLSAFYADCVPVFLVDPIKEAIGLCHSGWKGTVAEIGLKTVQRMCVEYGSKPEDIHAGIAPSICQDCYEVSEDVILQIKNTFETDAYPKDICRTLFYKKENGKYQLSLWNACRETLIKAGLEPEHIEVTDICTCCNPDYLFSHRASQGKRGNLGAFLMLK